MGKGSRGLLRAPQEAAAYRYGGSESPRLATAGTPLSPTNDPQIQAPSASGLFSLGCSPLPNR